MYVCMYVYIYIYIYIYIMVADRWGQPTRNGFESVRIFFSRGDKSPKKKSSSPEVLTQRIWFRV